MFERIKNVEYDMPPNKDMPEVAVDLIQKLLVRDPQERLGASTKPGYTFADLKQHKFFKGLNINNLFNEKPPDTPE